MNTQVHVLFLSACAADQTVLAALLRQRPGDEKARLSVVRDAQAFFDAVNSEERYQVIVVDEQLGGSDWRRVADTCVGSQPSALMMLLTGQGLIGRRAAALGVGVAAVYPRSSAGLVALACLVAKLVAQGDAFSLRREQQVVGEELTEAAGHDRERLVYAVSHDLQDPLQLARRYAEILTDDFHTELGDSGSKVLTHLTFNLDRTQEMLDELLDYSRLQNAGTHIEPVDCNALFEEVIGLYRLALDEIGGSVNLQSTLPTLLVDRRQFHRVFQNLISNAIKFRSGQPLQITVRAQQVRNVWRIGIKDNGIGIAEEDASRVFGMFERASAADKYAGTGMGLAICKRIIRNYTGKIWVRSSPGGGSVFIFSVPQSDAAAAESAEPSN